MFLTYQCRPAVNSNSPVQRCGQEDEEEQCEEEGCATDKFKKVEWSTLRTVGHDLLHHKSHKRKELRGHKLNPSTLIKHQVALSA